MGKLPKPGSSKTLYSIRNEPAGLWRLWCSIGKFVVVRLLKDINKSSPVGWTKRQRLATCLDATITSHKIVAFQISPMRSRYCRSSQRSKPPQHSFSTVITPRSTHLGFQTMVDWTKTTEGIRPGVWRSGSCMGYPFLELPYVDFFEIL